MRNFDQIRKLVGPLVFALLVAAFAFSSNAQESGNIAESDARLRADLESTLEIVRDSYVKLNVSVQATLKAIEKGVTAEAEAIALLGDVLEKFNKSAQLLNNKSVLFEQIGKLLGVTARGEEEYMKYYEDTGDLDYKQIADEFEKIGMSILDSRDKISDEYVNMVDLRDQFEHGRLKSIGWIRVGRAAKAAEALEGVHANIQIANKRMKDYLEELSKASQIVISE